MNKIVVFIAFSLILPIGLFAQLTTLLIAPHDIDTAYSLNQDSNYAVYDNNVATNGKLLFFIGGTGSHTIDFTEFVNLAATLGYHCVVVAYRDTPEVASVCKNSTDSFCYNLYRQQVCYGTPVSTANVDTFNSLVVRMQNLVTYLDTTYPAAGWGQFIAGGQPVWSKIAIAGHSQGSGHAMYIAKTNHCERALLFSGSDDISLYYQAPALWEAWPSATPDSSLYGFLSLGNEGIPYADQYLIQQLLGVTVSGDSVDADTASPPYHHTHELYTDLTPLHSGAASYHCSTVCNFFTPISGGTPVYNPIWTYMLTDTGTMDTTAMPNGIPASTNHSLIIYPNPASAYLDISSSSPSHGAVDMILYNDLGQKVYSIKTLPNGRISLPALPDGLYTLQIDHTETYKVTIRQ
jgi:hypothetical protein